ncbi:MAG TPA: phosphoglycerate mutase family protein [Ignavibacteria bacterium]|nr:phosphoglycerate mutase family protein [Ignavibacteria bacterium]HMR41253.1 phosphoglycerate mutase family protein [Ignavibacteria bacterium]
MKNLIKDFSSIKLLFIIPAVFFVLSVSSCTTKYYLVRHAEKLNNTDTSSLTPDGVLRSIALKDLLAGKDIKKIYASVYKRTRLTAKPLADATGEQILLYSPDTTAAFGEYLKKLSGTSVLIVGHTNNIPELIEILSGDAISPIPENDFDNIYTIEVKRDLVWISRYLTSSTYGAQSP